MTLTVAIASEFDPYDGEIYRYLLETVLRVTVVKWTGTFMFSGYRTVAKFAPAFLTAAAGHNIQHAILAVDNDGGARRRPEHAENHEPTVFALDDDDVCRECWLTQALPITWGASGGRSCVVVPVQVIETWLLAIRGDELIPTAEQKYNRSAIKKEFFGRQIPPLAQRIALAMHELQKPNALTILGERPSFNRFVNRLRSWE